MYDRSMLIEESSGEAGIRMSGLSDAITVWAVMNNIYRSVTVEDAMIVFVATQELVIEAVKGTPYLVLVGDEGEPADLVIQPIGG